MRSKSALIYTRKPRGKPWTGNLIWQEFQHATHLTTFGQEKPLRRARVLEENQTAPSEATKLCGLANTSCQLHLRLLGGYLVTCAFWYMMMMHFSDGEVPPRNTWDSQQCSQTGQWEHWFMIRMLFCGVWELFSRLVMMRKATTSYQGSCLTSFSGSTNRAVYCGTQIIVNWLSYPRTFACCTASQLSFVSRCVQRDVDWTETLAAERHDSFVCVYYALQTQTG